MGKKYDAYRNGRVTIAVAAKRQMAQSKPHVSWIWLDSLQACQAAVLRVQDIRHMPIQRQN